MNSERWLTILQSVSPAVLRRLMREISELQRTPPEGIRILASEDNMLDVTGVIEGPGAWLDDRVRARC